MTTNDEEIYRHPPTLLLATVRGPVRDVMADAGLWHAMADRIFPSVVAAVGSVDPHSPLVQRDSDEVPTDVV